MTGVEQRPRTMNYEEEYARLLQFLLYRKPGILCEYARHKGRVQVPGPTHSPSPTPRTKPLVRCVRLMRSFLKVF